MKTALIIGGSSGIGQALAWELANHNIKVLITGRNENSLLATKNPFPNLLTTIIADISTDAGRKTLVNRLAKEELDLVVFNAATEGPIVSFEEIFIQDWQKTIDTNLTAYFVLTQQLLIDKFLKNNARILFVSSGLDRLPLEGALSYCVSKAGFRMLAECLREEKIIQAQNILIGITNPGPADTGMQKRLREYQKNPLRQMFQQLKNENQLKSKEDIAKFFCWLLLHVSPKEFCSTYWDFYDKQIELRWRNEDTSQITN